MQSIVIVIRGLHWHREGKLTDSGEAMHRQISMHEEPLVNLCLLLIDQNEHVIDITFLSTCQSDDPILIYVRHCRTYSFTLWI